MRAQTQIIILIGAFVLAALILKFSFSGERDFENAALGTLTVSYQSQNAQGETIHTIKHNENVVDQMLLEATNSDHIILILGNSQTHSINQKEPGQVVYPELLQRNLTDACVLTNSLPNANLQEFFLLLNWWHDQTPIDQLVLPIFMDDLREDGLRKDFMQGLTRDTYSIESPKDSREADWNLQLQSFLPQLEIEDDTKSTSDTPQDRVEYSINSWLSQQSETWRNRSNARGDLFLKLYAWRNTLFGINATSERKMISVRYEKNFMALRKTLDFASLKGIPVLLYIPPIRTDVKVPYDLAEYDVFKSQIASMASEYEGVTFKNWESIVPGALWGLKASTSGDTEPELDFMHFQFRGHEILADSILNVLKP